MKRLTVGLLGLLLLTGCGILGPKATVNVEVLPAGVNAHTSIWDGSYKTLGEWDGDFTASLPADRVILFVTADGYDSQSIRRTLTPGEVADITVRLVEQARVSFTGFSVTRYETARLSMSGVVSANYSGGLTLRASCKEDGFSNLTTNLSARTTVEQGVSRSVTLGYSSGFSYFTSNTVRCSFSGETDAGATVVVN